MRVDIHSKTVLLDVDGVEVQLWSHDKIGEPETHLVHVQIGSNELVFPGGNRGEAMLVAGVAPHDPLPPTPTLGRRLVPVRAFEQVGAGGVDGGVDGDGDGWREWRWGVSGCAACGRRLWFSERVAFPSEFCFGCAQTRGVIRVADATRIRNLHTRASALPRWWQWTVFVEHAIAWSQPSPLDALEARP